MPWSEPKKEERGAINEAVYPTETDLKQKIRTGRDKRNGVKRMMEKEVDLRQHSKTAGYKRDKHRDETDEYYHARRSKPAEGHGREGKAICCSSICAERF